MLGHMFLLLVRVSPNNSPDKCTRTESEAGKGMNQMVFLCRANDEPHTFTALGVHSELLLLAPLSSSK